MVHPPPPPSVASPSSSSSSVARSANNRSAGGHKRSRRHQPSAASTVSSQLDRPYLFAFLALLVIYMVVTVLTYEKLSQRPAALVSSPDVRDNPNAAVSKLDRPDASQWRRRNDDDPHGSSSPLLEQYQYHSFPWHVTTSDSEWINHPGLELVKTPGQIPSNLPRQIWVPKFWSTIAAPQFNQSRSVRDYLGNNGQQLMTPEQAAAIGSYAAHYPKQQQQQKEPQQALAQSTPNDPHQQQDPPQEEEEEEETVGMLETIYCSVASYRDYECTPTVIDLYERAQYPERIRVAVVDQSVAGQDTPCLTPPQPCSETPDHVLCKYRHLMDYYHLEAQLAVGPVFARHLAHRLYRGEYYAMQVDSHVRFIQNWDTDMIQQWKSAKNEMAVLTTYLSDIHDRIDPITHAAINKNRPIMCASDFEGGGDNKHLRHGQQPEGAPGIHGQPTLHPFWAAGFSFARGHFVVQVPYDQYLPMVFQGEEISIGLRGFTYGYDYYAPEKGVCFHMYASRDDTKQRAKVPLFWENSKIYTGVGRAAMIRLNTLINMTNKDYAPSEWNAKERSEYSLGQVRNPDKFFTTFGIHVKEQTVEHHLCRFVGKPMMKQFLPALRSNRMGLDYDQIQYEYKDRG